MKCANCSRDAIYLYHPKPLSPAAYCNAHLPGFLRHAAKVGVLPTLPAYDEMKTAVLAKLSPEAPHSEPEPEPEATPEPEVEETETPPAEAPKPRKRRAPRKKAEPAPESAE